MKIIDCFPYFNEKELLELRISLLYDVVDQFIICDADHTHSGIPKEFSCQKMIQELGLPTDKIKVIEIELPGLDIEPSHLKRENLQRDIAAKYVDEDSVIFCTDCDEIINPEFVKYYTLIATTHPDNILHIPMVFLAGKADLNVHDNYGNPRAWNAGFVCLPHHLKNYTLSTIRESYTLQRNDIIYKDIFIYDNGNIIDAGWHFTWMGDQERLKTKFLSFNNSDGAIAGAAKGKNTNEEIVKFLDSYVPQDGDTEPLGRQDHILKKYPLSKLPRKIFELNRVQKFLLGKSNVF
jgi:beta-1,4-mannosyl-glycoprotein beta-1,4-N-acetylglucosaminyltransferase